MTTDSFTQAIPPAYSDEAWDDATNWSDGAIPQPGDAVAIPSVASGANLLVEIAPTDPAYTVASLSIDAEDQNFPRLVYDEGSLTVTGSTTVNSTAQLFVQDGGSLNLQGTTTISDLAEIGANVGTLTIGTLLGSGLVNVQSGTVSIATLDSQGKIRIYATGSVTIGQFGAGYAGSFDIEGGTLVIGDVGSTFTGVITKNGVASIDATAVRYQFGDTVRVTQTTGFSPYQGTTYQDSVAVVSPLGQTLFTLAEVGTGTSATIPMVAVSSDTDGGTLISIACYTPGTLIQTPAGEQAAGALRVGDLVTTLDGRSQPVRWIGRRSYAGRFLARQPHLLPVRIHAGALGGGLPRRDLVVSPCHAMYLDGVLVPASCLVNGQSITQDHAVERVEYVHIELAQHEVIFAEGAPSETFLDDDSRNAFHNASEYARLYPKAPVHAPRYYAPRVTEGFEVEAIRARLDTFGTLRRAA